MSYDSLTGWVVSVMLVGLRVAPVFAFAPPFTLVRMPLLFRILFGLGISVSLVAMRPLAASLVANDTASVVTAGFRELGLGVMVVLVFQLAFAALYVAGRTIDIQAGYGLALLIDPTSKSQVPMIGTLFAYAAAAVFFGFDGHVELLKLLAASFDAIPLGSWTLPHSIDRVAGFTALMFLGAFGIGSASILTLFLADMTIALLARTVPQLNALVLGFQVKTIVLLAVLPMSFGLLGALFLRLMATALHALPKLM